MSIRNEAIPKVLFKCVKCDSENTYFRYSYSSMIIDYFECMDCKFSFDF